MYSPGHFGLTTGTASVGAAYWLHRKFDQQPKSATDSFRKRLSNRGPEVLKGLSAVAVADIVSLVVDYDIALGLGHRTVTHSAVTATALKPGVTYVGDRIADAVERTAQNWKLPQLQEDLADPIRENAGLYGTAIAAGIGLHSLGDIPTGGIGGSALQLLWPISSHSFSLGLVSAASPQLNTALFVGGLSLAAVAWATIIARILFPDETWITLKQKIIKLKNSIKERLVAIGRKAKQAAKSLLDRAKSFVRKLFGKTDPSSGRGVVDGGKPISRKPVRTWREDSLPMGITASDGNAADESPNMTEPRALTLGNDTPPHLRRF